MRFRVRFVCKDTNQQWKEAKGHWELITQPYWFEERIFRSLHEQLGKWRFFESGVNPKVWAKAHKVTLVLSRLHRTIYVYFDLCANLDSVFQRAEQKTFRKKKLVHFHPDSTLRALALAGFTTAALLGTSYLAYKTWNDRVEEEVIFEKEEQQEEEQQEEEEKKVAILEPRAPMHPRSPGRLTLPYTPDLKSTIEEA